MTEVTLWWKCSEEITEFSVHGAKMAIVKEAPSIMSVLSVIYDLTCVISPPLPYGALKDTRLFSCPLLRGFLFAGVISRCFLNDFFLTI